MKSLFKIIFLCTAITKLLFSSEFEFTKEEKEWISNNPKIFVAIHQTKPYASFENGKAQGFTVDILNEISKQININFEFKKKSIHDVLQSLQNGSAHIATSLLENDYRKEYALFGDSWFYIKTGIFVQNKNKHLNSLEKLKGKTIVTFKEYSLIQTIKNRYPSIKFIYKDTFSEVLKAVSKGEGDATIYEENVFKYEVRKNKIDNIVISGNIDSIREKKLKANYFVVSKHYEILNNILNKAYTNIDQNEFLEIWKKWFNLLEYSSDDKNIISSESINSLMTKKKNSLLLTKEEEKYLSEKEYFSVLNLENFHPFNFRNDGKAMGYSVDIMKLIGSELNKEIKFIKKPWNVQLEMLKNSQLDIIPHLVITEDRMKFADYTDFTHLTFSIGFALKTNNSIKSIKDLEGKTLAVVDGYYLHEYLKKNFPEINLYLAKSTYAAMDAVVKDKAYAAIDNIPTFNYFIQEKWLNNLKINSIDDLGLSLDTKVPMGVRKGNVHLKSILEKVNASIEKKQLNEIKQKWIIVNNKNMLNNLTLEEVQYLKEKKDIKMCVLPDRLPFEQIDENMNHKGIGADILKIVSKKINKDFILVPTKDWGDSLQNIRDRKCDILPIAMNVESRRDSMNFTKPYATEPFVIATTSDKFYVRDISDLSDKKIGIVKNYAIMDVVKKQNPLIKLVELKNTEEGLKKVANGKLYGYIDTMPTIAYFIQKHGLFDLKIAGKLSPSIELSMASRNDEPLLNDILQKALNTINQEEIRTIVGKWIKIKVQQEPDYQKLIYLSLFFLLVFFIVLYKNRSINIINRKLELANRENLDKQLMVDKYVMLLTTDLEGQITSVNNAYSERLGYKEEELIGKNHSLVKHNDIQNKVFEDLWKTIKNDKIWKGEIKNYTKDKKTVYFNVIIESVFVDGKKIGYSSISEDITDKKRIEELSITDKLTGLYNRLKIDEILVKQVNIFERYKTGFSIILLDVDNFKKVNDIYGHDTGDYILKDVASLIKKSIRKTDEVGRWGGEEFIIICTNTSCEESFVLCENIREEIEKYSFDEVEKVTVSLGVSSFTSEDDIQSLFKRVDKGLYKAKNSGRNRTIMI